MQVLVLLAGARGAVVDRERLTARCWDGRVVGDNAVNRVISILRRLATETGAFQLETVPRVGYRLIEQAPEGAPVEAQARQGRRVGLAVMLGLAALGLGLAAWCSPRWSCAGRRPTPRGSPSTPR